jgi:ubiquinone/menaquinone biosynthesis C-methylase UbiE
MSFLEKIDKPRLSYYHELCFSLCKNHIENQLILDIGCWSGNFEFFVNISKTVAIDIERRALIVAKKNFPNVNFVLASALYLPFLEGTFNVATMWCVIEHLPINSENKVFIEANRVLKDFGSLFLSTENDHCLANCLDPARVLVGHRHYSLALLNTLLRASHFEVKTIYYRGGLLNALFVVISYVFKHILHRPMPRIKAIDHLIEKEWHRKGFQIIFIVAKKNGDLQNISKVYA